MLKTPGLGQAGVRATREAFDGRQDEDQDGEADEDLISFFQIQVPAQYSF